MSRYTPKNSAEWWNPTPPDYAEALEPNWSRIRTLVLDSAMECKPPPPPSFSLDTASVFFHEVREVYEQSLQLDSNKIAIAQFWDDNPFTTVYTGHVSYSIKKYSPGAHWILITSLALRKTNAGLMRSAEAYTLVSLSLFDAFISCWDEKYRSNVIRPETVINKYIDAEWRPYIQTPPFPSYTSGHSVISGSVAEVMTQIFGDNFSYTDTSEIEFGIPHRSFTSFRQAALEASWSRMYGGIHYRFDLENGNKQGIEVGKIVVDRLRMRKNSNSALTRK